MIDKNSKTVMYIEIECNNDIYHNKSKFVLLAVKPYTDTILACDCRVN